MWPSASFWRLMSFIIILLIYIIRKAQWEEQLKTLIKLLPVLHQTRRMDLTLWLLVSACFCCLLRTIRLHLMKICERRASNLEEMELYLNQQQTEPGPLSGTDAAEWDALIEKRMGFKIERIGDVNQSN